MYKKQAALLFTSLVGALLSVYATILTIEVRNYDADVQSICSINALFDCNYVAASEAALLFGIPVAWWAFTYYLWIGSLVIWTFISSANQRPIMAMALIISTLALTFTLYKAYQMIFQLKVVCLVCILMYCANAAIALLLISVSGLKLRQMLGRSAATSQQIKKESWQNSIAAYLPAPVSVIVVFLIGYSVINISFPAQIPDITESILTRDDQIPNNATASDLVASHFAQPRRIIELVPNAPMWGNPRARVTIVDFSDFQCPFCRIAASHLKDVLSEFRDEIKLYFVHYPLDPSINPFISTTGHQYAGLAARAAIYAQDRGNFWEFHDELFQQQPNLSDETIFTLAKRYGWNIDQFKNAVKSTEIIDRVKKHIQCGQDVEIQGTPTIYINGRHVEQWNDPSVLRQIIKHEILSSRY
jgi:protein-disulfide isomerase/uncharacterized membrane protein